MQSEIESEENGLETAEKEIERKFFDAVENLKPATEELKDVYRVYGKYVCVDVSAFLSILEASNKRVAELEGALEPFVAAMKWISDKMDDDYAADWTPFIPYGAYRRAAAALKGAPMSKDKHAEIVLSASNRKHVAILAEAIASIPSDEQPHFLTIIHKLKLMRCVQWPLSWMLRWVHFSRGHPSMVLFFKQMRRRSPDAFRDWMQQTIDHCLNGVDTEDENSAGGWSQREIDMLLSRWIFPGVENAILKGTS